ncbi:uncharacterized protein LOC123916784 isoform X7 [Trifolium pratense]|uniref:uncharacterized protein LOC123916784 isoform X7 n=1 Tax=Trifolium pratense TaxID=57577 RepID=UPI001E69218D|nr:uncharacterized protein LOC123916784 isoform X7 [Trifolium pratense]
MKPSKSNNTETEEETISFNRKRARRVSFADNEITSVHIFRPDDDHSSPSSDEIPAETLDLFRQLVAESDDEEPDRRRNSTDGEGEAVDHRNSFLQPIGSPSPGGSSINADDDTDDDEFGGPVSMDFIKPGRLSDSGVSDDITMDSTAFSMHYRSLARSDSGDLKTPTRFEATVSTPGLSSATPGSFMELTDREKRVPQSPVVASASEDSDAMSIEGEQPKTYDYGRLSPGLVAILAQGSKDLDGVSPLGSKATHSPIAVAFGSSTKSPLTKTGIEVSSGKKRKGVQLLSNGDDIEKTGRIDRSQEVHKSGDGDLQFVLEQTSMRSEREKFGDQKWNDFDHVLERFSTSTKQLLSPSFDKLNFRLMGTLEDILVRLQKVKKWDILSSEIHSQKLTDPLDIPRQKYFFCRVVEMKLLLFNIAYEKAKLQLLNVKRERLLEKVQQLSSGLQETQMMKNSMPCSAKTRLVDIQADDSHINTKIFNSQGKCQSALKGKPARSPPNRFPDLSSPIQDATTALPSLQEPPSDIQDLSPGINSDGHGVDLDNNHHLTFQVAQSPLKTGIEVSSGEKRNDVDLDNNGHPTLQVAQSPPTKTSIEVSSGKKRKGVQLLSNGDDIEKTGRIDRSQEVHKSGDGDLQFVLEQTSMRSEREKFGDQKWNDFDHVLERFSTSTKQLLSPSFDKLNFRLMGTLEDILVRLQKVKKWDILSSEIHSQKKLTDPLDIPRHKRVVEMKLLLFNIAYEKAKLQLMNVKRERLLEKVQQLSSGLQETQMMKNSMPCSAKTRLVDIQADDSHIKTKIFNSQGKCQVSCKNVMETRQELENLDQKAKSLSEFFYSYCKMKGDQSYTNVVRSVRDYLEKRISYKLVFQNLKLWDVEDFERKDDYHMIILNYRGYIIQRFTVNAGLSSIIVSNSLNDVNIGKTYPNMEAFSAFVFALNPHTTSKCTGRISMAQETQITGSLLSNLLDVVEEVQLARVEIRNLVQAKFNSHSVNQLDLQLSFIDFCGGKKVQVILDMTCLKCGAYPAEVLPSQIYGLAANGEQKALPSSLVDEIRSAAESVSVGYSRIVRLCRCISQAVQGCTQGR